MLRRPRDPIADLARSRSQVDDLAMATTDRAIDLGQLARALGCWFMVDHAGLEEGKPKRVFATCSQARLEAVLGRLRAKRETRPS